MLPNVHTDGPTPLKSVESLMEAWANYLRHGKCKVIQIRGGSNASTHDLGLNHCRADWSHGPRATHTLLATFVRASMNA